MNRFSKFVTKLRTNHIKISNKIISKIIDLKKYSNKFNFQKKCSHMGYDSPKMITPKLIWNKVHTEPKAKRVSSQAILIVK